MKRGLVVMRCLCSLGLHMHQNRFCANSKGKARGVL